MRWALAVLAVVAGVVSLTLRESAAPRPRAAE